MKVRLISPALVLSSIVTLASGAMVIFYWRVAIEVDETQQHVAFSQALSQIESEFMVAIDDRAGALDRMAKRLAFAEQSLGPAWDADASSYIEHFKDLEAITIQDANYIVKRTYPMNSKLVGINTASDDPKRRMTFERALSKRRPTLSPMIELFSGGRGFLIVAPIIKAGELKGFVVGRLRARKFFARVLVASGYSSAIYEFGELVSSAPGFEDSAQVEVSRKLSYEGIDWTIKVRPTKDTLFQVSSRIPEIILYGGGIGAFLLGLCFHLWLIARRKSTLLTKAYREVQSGHEKISALLRLAPVGIYQSDANLNIQFVNRRWEEITGLSSEEATSDAITRLIHPEDLERVRSESQVGIKQDRPFELKYRYARRDGRVVWVNSHCTTLKDSKGETSGFLLAIEDITQKKMAEDELRESKEFLAAVVENLPTALFCKDVTRNFEYALWNRQAAKFWGLEPEQVLGKNDRDFFPQDEAEFFRQKDNETMVGGRVLEIAEEKITAPGKETMFLHTLKVPIYDLEGKPKYLLGISQDITEKKKQTEIIERQQLRIAHAEKLTSLGQMAGGIAHEINSPLAIIELTTSNLEEALTMDPRPEVAKMLKTISSTVGRIAKIISGLRNFARDGEGDPFVTKPVRDILQESLDFCRERFKHHAIELRLNDVPTHIAAECRPVQISQVILNLLNNAYDSVLATGQGWIDVSVRLEREHIYINITDSGKLKAGIEQKMMQPFFTTKEVGKATGLGLSISHGIAKAHGGDLYFDPKAGNTRFILKLPIRQTAQVAS